MVSYSEVRIGGRRVSTARIGGRAISWAGGTPPIDPPVGNWADAPANFTRTFLDTFPGGLTGTVNGWQTYQGIDRSKWETRGSGLPDDRNARNNGAYVRCDGDKALVPADGGLMLYGGVLNGSGGTWPLANAERGMAEISSRDLIIKSPAEGEETRIRFRCPWRPLAFYNKNLWAFGAVEGSSAWPITQGNHSFNFELDLETNPAEYDGTPGNRSFVAHFNFHCWTRLENLYQCMKSTQHQQSSTIALPDDEDAELTFEIRWARGSDFFDPTQTYFEWWVETVENGEATGVLERRYHVSPQSHIYSKRNNSGWMYNSTDYPTVNDPLPSAYNGIAPDAMASGNWFHSSAANSMLNPDPSSGSSPYNKYYNLGANLQVPYIRADDSSWTWIEGFREIWGNSRLGEVVLTCGFYGSGYFLQGGGEPARSTYSGDPSFVDDGRAFADPITGVAVYELGEDPAPLTEVYIDSAVGNDANDGSSLSPWASLSKITGSLLSQNTRLQVFISAGTYDTADDYIAVATGSDDKAGATLELNFESGCTLDGTAANAGTPTNGINLSGDSNWVCEINGNGLTIQNYDVGISANDALKAYVYDCTINDPIASTGTSTTKLYDCTMTEAVGFGSATGDSNLVQDCVLTPASQQTADSIANTVFRRSQVGADNAFSDFDVQHTSGTPGPTFENCFISLLCSNVNDITISNCYGNIYANIAGSGGTFLVEHSSLSSFGIDAYDSGTAPQWIIRDNVIMSPSVWGPTDSNQVDDLIASGSVFENNVLVTGYTTELQAASPTGLFGGVPLNG